MVVTCPFCGQDNRPGARSCVACGFVFPPTGTGAPEALGAPAPPAPAAAPEAPSLASLYDPESVAKSARQALVMLAIAGALALAAAVGVITDAMDALDTVGEGGLGAGAPDLAPRSGLLDLAELSVAAGTLVMLGGWAQQVAANRALLAPAASGHSSRFALGAWLIPGANVVLPGVVVGELWRDATPPANFASPLPHAVYKEPKLAGARAGPGAPAVLRAWPAVFGGALAGRYVALGFGFAGAPELRSDGDVVVTSVVLVGALVLWGAALALSAVLVRALTAHQAARAGALAAASA